MTELLAIDIGGSKTTVALLDQSGEEIQLISKNTFKTCLKPDHQIQTLLDTVNSLAKKSKFLTLSLPGVWDEKGALKESFNLPGWINYPFISMLVSGLQIEKVFWETDVICGALGDYYAFNKDENISSILYMNLGTGIGASYLKDGIPFKSNKKNTIRLQKLVVPIDDELHDAVDLISGNGLVKASNIESVETIFKNYRNGNVETVELISMAQTQLAACLINLFYIFSPEVIVLSGGLTNEWDVLAGGAIEIAKEELHEQVKILPSKLKDSAPIYGAGINFKNHMEQENRC